MKRFVQLMSALVVASCVGPEEQTQTTSPSTDTERGLTVKARATIVIRAAGVLLDDVGPIMQVRLGTLTLATIEVRNTSLLDTVLTVEAPPPGTRLDVVFTNGVVGTRAGSRTTRKLIIDRVTVNGQPLAFEAARYDTGIGAAAFDDLNVKPAAAGAQSLSGALRFVLTSGLSAPQVGLVINDNDPYSLAVGAHYQQARQIPATNVVHVRLPVRSIITAEEFAPAKAQIDAAMPPYVQALALAWKQPWSVGDTNSITSAVTRGFTGPWVNPMYTDPTGARLPFTRFGLRPSMLLAAADVAGAIALIDRGVAADATNPRGSGYLMNTSDGLRSLRARPENYAPAYLGTAISPRVEMVLVNADFIQQPDILFYFQGLAQVPNLGGANRYLPGAIADNFTSYGGRLDDPFGQTSVLEFINAGATGTFGTVTEPFAISLKFPNPRIAVTSYTRGQTLIETYWKTVYLPLEGLFVGEPLANPWARLVPPLDTQAPTTPGGVFAVGFTTSIQVGWSQPSVDDVGVVEYRLYRFGTLFMTAPGTSGGFVDVNVQVGQTYEYTVTAVDEAGNESPHSPVVSATPPPPADGGVRDGGLTPFDPEIR